MWDTVQIENIEEMRRRQGIEDVELREDIRVLAVGDLVRLTVVPRDQSWAGETLVVRITSIKGTAFRGKLASQPVSKGLAGVCTGTVLAFTAAHIHSLLKRRPTHG